MKTETVTLGAGQRHHETNPQRRGRTNGGKSTPIATDEGGVLAQSLPTDLAIETDTTGTEIVTGKSVIASGGDLAAGRRGRRLAATATSTRKARRTGLETSPTSRKKRTTNNSLFSFCFIFSFVKRLLPPRSFPCMEFLEIHNNNLNAEYRESLNAIKVFFTHFFVLLKL